MTLTPTERTDLVAKLKAMTIFVPTATNAEITSALDLALFDIPSDCKKRFYILEYLTIHLILESRKATEKTKKGDLADSQEMQRVGLVGDVNTSFFKKDSGNYNPDYDTTFWGAKARRMIEQCKRGRIGYIY